MTMGSLRFYKNKYRYPHYSPSVTAVGSSMPCVPVGIGFKSGTIKVKGSMTDFMNCNYLQFTRDNVTLWGWIDDVKFHTADSFEVTYSVDAWRTYRSKIDLGVQYIARSPVQTNVFDPMLGSLTPDEIHSNEYEIGNASRRIFVVQVRAQSGEIFSRTPVQPTPYRFYLASYDVNNWMDTKAIDDLMVRLSFGAETQNIVTMYSIPYANISALPTGSLPVVTPSGTTHIPGWRAFTDTSDPSGILTIRRDIPLVQNVSDLLKVRHSVQVVIPEAGVIDIPDELLVKPNLRLRQDVDLFSGASNYMVETSGGRYYTQSVRGSSIASIPIVSDPLDTYLSQNQNGLATSLMGDVASMGQGAMAGFMAGGHVGAVAGGAMGGATSILNRSAAIKDATSKFSNPPAFLGTALASRFNQRFWVVEKYTGVDNRSSVNQNFGYPYELVAPLTFPSSGFIQTEGCSVKTTDGSVPKWAIDEINSMFNGGVLVHTS